MESLPRPLRKNERKKAKKILSVHLAAVFAYCFYNNLDYTQHELRTHFPDKKSENIVYCISQLSDGKQVSRIFSMDETIELGAAGIQLMNMMKTMSSEELKRTDVGGQFGYLLK